MVYLREVEVVSALHGFRDACWLKHQIEGGDCEDTMKQKLMLQSLVDGIGDPSLTIPESSIYEAGKCVVNLGPELVKEKEFENTSLVDVKVIR